MRHQNTWISTLFLLAAALYWSGCQTALGSKDASDGDLGTTSSQNSDLPNESEPESDDSSLENDAAATDIDREKTTDVEDSVDRVSVKVHKIGHGDIYDYILGDATIEAERRVDIYSKVTGRVIDLNVEEGDLVNRDELLAAIDDREFRLEVDKAKAEYDKKVADYKRFERMFNEKLLSGEQFEDAKYQSERARLSWESAKLNLDEAHLRAPIDGMVTVRDVRFGDWLAANKKAFSLVDMNSLEAIVNLPENDLPQLKRGQAARIRTDVFGDKTFDGRVKLVSPVVDSESATVKVTVSIVNQGLRLRPGMFVNVEILTEKHSRVVLVPKKAVVYELDSMYVYIVEDGKAIKRALTAGVSDGSYHEARLGVQQGEEVIVVGQSGLKDGTLIQIVR